MDGSIERVAEQPSSAQDGSWTVLPHERREAGPTSILGGLLRVPPLTSLCMPRTGRSRVALQPVYRDRLVTWRNPPLATSIRGVVMRFRVCHVGDGDVELPGASRHPMSNGAVANKTRP